MDQKKERKKERRKLMRQYATLNLDFVAVFFILFYFVITSNKGEIKANDGERTRFPIGN